MSNFLETARLWETGDDSGLGIFATMEVIIDNQHRDTMVDEIDTRLDQIESYKETLQSVIDLESELKNFRVFVKNTEIVSDYGR